MMQGKFRLWVSVWDPHRRKFQNMGPVYGCFGPVLHLQTLKTGYFGPRSLCLIPHPHGLIKSHTLGSIGVGNINLDMGST